MLVLKNYNSSYCTETQHSDMYFSYLHFSRFKISPNIKIYSHSTKIAWTIKNIFYIFGENIFLYFGGKVILFLLLKEKGLHNFVMKTDNIEAVS